MKKGKNYIKLLCILNIFYIFILVIFELDAFSVIAIKNVIFKVLLNLIIFLGITYAIYKKKNIARLFLSGFCVLALFSSFGNYIEKTFAMLELFNSIYALLCLFILSRKEVIQYISSSKETSYYYKL